MFAYTYDSVIVVSLDDGEKATFDTLTECLWDCLELNIENYDVGCWGNDCLGCSMLGIIDGEDVEIKFCDRDVTRLNKMGLIRLYPVDTCRDEWFLFNESLIGSKL